MKVHISRGNDKLGAIPNISLSPGRSCGDVPCKKDCYAMKFYGMYPTVKRAWSENYRIATSNRPRFFGTLDDFLRKYTPKFFRFHVAGDFIDQNYLEWCEITASRHPETRFLAFTKKYGLDYSKRPANMEIVFSAWPGLALPRKKMPVAFMQDGTETRVKNALDCPGNCESCGMCFNLSKLGKNVVFNKH
jgi:hypothetical protein